MPKMKTKSCAKKRFQVTGSGKVKSRPACKRHRLISKSKSMKRKARGQMILNESQGTVIRNSWMPYARRPKNKSNKPAAKAEVGGA
jgi:large subunit ribosomal protein L35